MQTPMRPALLTLFLAPMALLAQAPPPPQFGLLVGLARYDGGANEVGAPMSTRQPLATWHVTSLNGRVTTALLPNLVVPTATGFARRAIERRCEPMTDPENEFCHDAVIDVDAQPRRQVRWDDHPGPSCSYGYLRPLFVSPTLFSVKTWSGLYGDCELSFSQRQSAVVTPLQDTGANPEVSFTDVGGPGAPEAFDTARRRAQARLDASGAAETFRPCEAGVNDSSTDWSVHRAGTRWVAALDEEVHPECQAYEAIDHALPASIVGFTEPPLSWAAIGRAHPDATEAHGSPVGPVMLLVQHSDLVVATTGGAVLARFDREWSDSVIMVQWAARVGARRWQRMLAGRAAPPRRR